MNIEFSERVGIYTCWRGDEKIATIQKKYLRGIWKWAGNALHPLFFKEYVFIRDKVRSLNGSVINNYGERVEENEVEVDYIWRTPRLGFKLEGGGIKTLETKGWSRKRFS